MEQRLGCPQDTCHCKKQRQIYSLRLIVIRERIIISPFGNYLVDLWSDLSLSSQRVPRELALTTIMRSCVIILLFDQKLRDWVSQAKPLYVMFT
jgi:hypothetical protein